MTQRKSRKGLSSEPSAHDATRQEGGASSAYGANEAESKIRRAPGGVGSTSRALHGLPLPDVIGQQYRVVGRLGEGAMGLVLRAEDMFLGRPVAIKIVEPDPGVLGRFIKEAQSLARIRHENVVQVYTFGPVQDSYYLAMELVVGQPLDVVIDELSGSGQTMPLHRAMNVLDRIGRGLEAIHAHHIIHRDIKPGNVILERGTDRPVLIDFGLARRRTKSSPKMSITGGTPSYMAPEQARDRDGSGLTHRTDIYAFACTAFELLTGRPVFEGDDIFTILLAHIEKPPPRISSVRPELAPIDDILLQALAKDPADRFTSTFAMVTALRKGLETVSARLDARAPSIAPPSAPRPALPEPRPARPAVLVLAAEPGLRRSIARNAQQVLTTSGVDPRLETAESAGEALDATAASTFDVVILDEESASPHLREIAGLVRAKRPQADVVIVSRDFTATQAALAPLAIRHLVPKPVNVHVLAAVLGRLGVVVKR